MIFFQIFEKVFKKETFHKMKLESKRNDPKNFYKHLMHSSNHLKRQLNTHLRSSIPILKVGRMDYAENSMRTEQ